MSTNLSKIKRNKMLDTIRQIKENINDDETLKNLSLIEYELTKKKYGLVWEEHEERVDVELKTKIPIFEEVKEKEILSKEDMKFNFLLEGDNLHSLYLLKKTHKGMIDVIYIDPPYNTQNNDFIYNDTMINAEDGFKHSKWISFMEKRLNFAKDLLSPFGTIWISIDENELFNLKMLCDEIFDEKNFRSLVTIVSNPGGRDYGGIAKTTEYVLVYSKTDKSIINKIHDESHVFEMKDEIGPFELRELRNRNVKFNDKNRPNLYYPFYVDINSADNYGLYSISLEKDEKHTVEVFPLKSQGIQTVWRWGKEQKARKNLNINIKAKQKKDGTFMIVEKYRDESVMMKNVWGDKNFRTENGSLQIKEIFLEKTFDYPKPVDIPLRVIESTSKKDSIILDFFAGSGTTAQAVLELNKKDGGNRQFILCTNNENNICEEITYQRIKTVITGKRKDASVYSEGIKANLKYFKISYIPILNTEEENIQENLLFNIKNLIQLENGISIDDRKIRIILNEEKIDEFSSTFEEVKACERLYISSDILLTAKQVKLFQDNNIEVYVIPEYYFDEEIKEVQ